MCLSKLLKRMNREGDDSSETRIDQTVRGGFSVGILRCHNSVHSILVQAAIGCMLLATSSQAAETYQARCHMDVCGWFQFEAKKPVEVGADGTLFKVRLIGGASYHPEGNYTVARPIEELWGKVGDDGLRKAAYRGG